MSWQLEKVNNFSQDIWTLPLILNRETSMLGKHASEWEPQTNGPQLPTNTLQRNSRRIVLCLSGMGSRNSAKFCNLNRLLEFKVLVVHLLYHKRTH